MKIERNTYSYGLTPIAFGYIITQAPAVHDIQRGGTWLFDWNGSDPDGEDTLHLLDLSEAQALSFSKDEDYERFLKDRSFCLSFDWSQTQASMPRSLLSRASHMFELAQDLIPAYTKQAQTLQKSLGRSV
jgi:hypothetical protein